MRTCAIVAALFAGSLALAGQDKPAVKEIPTKDLKVKFPEKGGKATEPAEIKTAEELAKSPVAGGAADEIKKQVNFDKEKLVVFAWGGSGGDKLATDLKTADKKTSAVFTLTRGLTRDFRQHIHLYVVPKDADVKVETAK
jgi:hypothetical protein